MPSKEVESLKKALQAIMGDSPGNRLMRQSLYAAIAHDSQLVAAFHEIAGKPSELEVELLDAISATKYSLSEPGTPALRENVQTLADTAKALLRTLDNDDSFNTEPGGYDIRQWPDSYHKTEPAGDPNWAWLQLWEEENPYPGSGANLRHWSDERRKMANRVWVAHNLPQFNIFDWRDEEITKIMPFIHRHVCGVCGRADDSGCVLNC